MPITSTPSGLLRSLRGGILSTPILNERRNAAYTLTLPPRQRNGEGQGVCATTQLSCFSIHRAQQPEGSRLQSPSLLSASAPPALRTISPSQAQGFSKATEPRCPAADAPGSRVRNDVRKARRQIALKWLSGVSVVRCCSLGRPAAWLGGDLSHFA